MQNVPPGSTWSNRTADGKHFKNLIDPPIPLYYCSNTCAYFKCFVRRTMMCLPGAPKEGYTDFGKRWTNRLNVAAEYQRLREDPATADFDRAFWINHATQVLCLRSGTTIMFDPIFSERSSPFQWIGPKRRYDPPTTIDELPRIDIVTVSHNHYDHLDEGSIREVYRRFPEVTFVLPLEMDKLFVEWGIPQSSIITMDWWDELRIKDVVIACLPAQHWGMRWSMLKCCDKNSCLWSGWAVGWLQDGSTDFPAPNLDIPRTDLSMEMQHARAQAVANDSVSSDEPVGAGLAEASPSDFSPREAHGADVDTSTQASHSTTTTTTSTTSDDEGEAKQSFGATDEIPTAPTVNWEALKTYFFTGDTYFNEDLFRLIHRRIPRFDMAGLPIGSYAPRWAMWSEHIDPEQAVEVFLLTNVQKAYAVHWASFELADEPLDEPPELLNKALQERGIPLENFKAIRMGDHVDF